MHFQIIPNAARGQDQPCQILWGNGSQGEEQSGSNQQKNSRFERFWVTNQENLYECHRIKINNRLIQHNRPLKPRLSLEKQLPVHNHILYQQTAYRRRNSNKKVTELVEQRKKSKLAVVFSSKSQKDRQDLWKLQPNLKNSTVRLQQWSLKLCSQALERVRNLFISSVLIAHVLWLCKSINSKNIQKTLP